MKRTAGIDIGTHSIKTIELEDRGGRLELINCAITNIVGGDIEKALKELLSRVKLSSNRVNISLSGPSVVVRYIEMPLMRHDELNGAIRFEAEKYIPFSINDSIIDFAPLDKTNSGNQRILLVAAKKNDVNIALGFFKGAGLEVRAIDVDSFALLNAFKRKRAEEKTDAACAIINAGERYCNMNIIIKDSIYFTRDLLWGGRDVTSRIKDVMGIGIDEAEELKKNPGEKRAEVVSAISPALDKLVSQIRMSFDYFESQFGKGVGMVYISGGSSYLFNIVDFLKDNLGVEVMMWDPFEGVKISSSVKERDESPALFTVATGLALRS